MAEVFMRFTNPLTTNDGVTFTAQVCGREAPDGGWEGWIEFEPGDGGRVLRTERESRQPNRADLEYWATGLTTAYLQGALDRALRIGRPRAEAVPAAERPVYDGPAPTRTDARTAEGSRRVPPRAVLDPFRVYGQGEEVLARELAALSPDQLRNIVRAHALAGDAELVAAGQDRARLTALIVTAARSRFD